MPKLSKKQIRKGLDAMSLDDLETLAKAMRKPSRPVRPISDRQFSRIEEAISFLLLARSAVWFAECPNTVKKIQSAIKSAKGALAHAERRRMHTPERNR